jgi:hypothetical protein
VAERSFPGASTPVNYNTQPAWGESADRVGHVLYELCPRARRRLGLGLSPRGERLERGHDKNLKRTSRILNVPVGDTSRKAGAPQYRCNCKSHPSVTSRKSCSDIPEELVANYWCRRAVVSEMHALAPWPFMVRPSTCHGEEITKFHDCAVPELAG